MALFFFCVCTSRWNALSRHTTTPPQRWAKDEAPCWDRTRQTFHNTKSSFSFLHFSYPNRDSDWQEINSPVCIYLTNHKINIKKKKKTLDFLEKKKKSPGAPISIDGWHLTSWTVSIQRKSISLLYYLFFFFRTFSALVDDTGWKFHTNKTNSQKI